MSGICNNIDFHALFFYEVNILSTSEQYKSVSVKYSPNQAKAKATIVHG